MFCRTEREVERLFLPYTTLFYISPIILELDGYIEEPIQNPHLALSLQG